MVRSALAEVHGVDAGTNHPRVVRPESCGVLLAHAAEVHH